MSHNIAEYKCSIFTCEADSLDEWFSRVKYPQDDLEEVETLQAMSTNGCSSAGYTTLHSPSAGRADVSAARRAFRQRLHGYSLPELQHTETRE
nr:hypothetical protein CFP56_22150 [Quercus suber]